MPDKSSAPELEASESPAVSISTEKSFVTTSSRSSICRQPWIFDSGIVTRGIDDPVDKLTALAHAGRHSQVDELEAELVDAASRWAAKNEITSDDFDSHEYCHSTIGLLSECST
jgi:hypothetical protein